MDESAVEVSVVLPAYNEERTLESTVATTLERLASFLPAGSFEVVVAEDGCDDATPEIADRLADADDRVRHFHSDERLGRGGALDAAFRAARGDVLVYFDTDLATDMKHLSELVESVRTGEYDVATGSRWMPGRRADRPAKRGIPSRGFNFLVRTFLGSDLRDHQCGFKAVSREAFADVGRDVEDDHWFWDTELLVRAQRRGYRVKEFPVDWTPKGDSKVDLMRDVVGMGSQILRCWWEFSVRPRITRRLALVVSTLLALLALGLMSLYIDVGAVVDRMAHADPVLVAVAALVYAASWPLRGLRYRDILDELGYHESAGFLTGAVFISQTGNLVFPARAGDAVRAYVVKTRRAVPYATGFASLAVERVFDLLTITTLAGGVLLGLALFAPDQVAALVAAVGGEASVGSASARSGSVAVTVAAAVGALALAAVAVIVVTARSDRNLVRWAVSRLSSDAYATRVAAELEQFVADVQTVAGDRAAFARVGVSSLAIWAIDVACALLVLRAFGVSVPLGQLLAVGFVAVSVGNLAKVLPLSPGGIGLYEGAFTLLVVVLSPVSAAVAFGAAIVDHALKNVVTVVGGAAAMLLFNLSLTQAVSGARAADPEADPDIEAAPRSNS